MRALVIDDSRIARVFVGDVLRGLGFDVQEAVNGREALDTLKQGGPFDVALVDWNMPVMNGYDFIKAVRQDSSFAELVLMMVTTENEQSQVVKALSAGANEYLMKPCTGEMLKEKLQVMGLI